MVLEFRLFSLPYFPTFTDFFCFRAMFQHQYFCQLINALHMDLKSININLIIIFFGCLIILVFQISQERSKNSNFQIHVVQERLVFVEKPCDQQNEASNITEVENTEPDTEKNTAICLTGKSQATKKVAENFKKYVLDQLNADVFIVTPEVENPDLLKYFSFAKSIVSATQCEKIE